MIYYNGKIIVNNIFINTKKYSMQEKNYVF